MKKTAAKKKEAHFPVKILSGAVQVKIYRTKHDRMKSGYVYQLAYHDGSLRRIKQFASLKDARATGRRIADELQAGRKEGQLIGTQDLDLLTEVRKIAGNTSPTEALKEWKRANEITRGNILDAARLWKRTHGAGTKKVTIKEAVDEFIASKRKMGKNVDETYVKRGYFPPFVAAFPNTLITEITTQQLERYLDQHGNSITRNTHRQKIVTLFNWAKRQGYLPRDRQTEAQLTDRAEERVEIVYFKPDAFKKILKLIATKHPHYLGALLLAGFCGMRRREVHAQKWEDIHIDKGHLYVTGAKRNTPQDRIIPFPEAVDWFLRCPDRTGKVCKNFAMDRIRDIARTDGVETPDNGFRRSFITYRMAQGHSAGQVAQWAGNSEKQIHRHYRKPRPKEEGDEWFGLSPEEVFKKDESKIIPMEEAK